MSGSTSTPAPERLDNLTIARSWVGGTIGAAPRVERAGPSARIALEQAIRRGLERTPCFVAFSGGRDSSAILALATHVARQESLPLPIPLTLTFPDVPESEETEWQELVVRHLQLQEWVREYPGDGMDLVGPVAQERLRRYGVLWPALLHSDEWMLRVARGGSLLTGQFGDETLDVGHRIWPVAATLRRLRRRKRVPRAQLQDALLALPPLTGRLLPSYWTPLQSQLPWLRPEAAADLEADVRRDMRRSPLSARRSILAVRRQRGIETLMTNRAYFADQADVLMVSPFGEPEVLHAIAREAGVFGFPSRASALNAVAGDVLPPPIIERTSKASFNATVFGPHSRRFVAGWDGSGADPDLVDVDVLRTTWAEEHVTAASFLLLQAAWLASQTDDAPSATAPVGGR